MEHAVVPAWAMLAYLASGVIFILALRGLSSPGTSRAGNRYGMIGMLIAVVTTLVTHELASLPEILGAIAIGGGVLLLIVLLWVSTENEIARDAADDEARRGGRRRATGFAGQLWSRSGSLRRRRGSEAARIRTAPKVMQISATLNVGQCQSRQ